MKRVNQNGFSVAEGLLVLVIIGLVAGVGFYVYKANQDTSKSLGNIESSESSAQKTKAETTPSEQSADETANWTLFSSSKGWSIRVPDGWSLYTNPDSEGLHSPLSLEYKPGVKATIEKIEGGRGGPFLLNMVNRSEQDISAQKPPYLDQEAVLKAKNVEGKKYFGMLREDEPMIGSRGDMVYQYVFTKNSKTIVVYSYQPQNSASILTQLEKSLSTLEIL